MAERYTRLFSLPENLYTEGAPVLVAAGALLRDNTTDTVLAQLKLKNIGEKEIRAATVKISSFDTAGRPLGEPIQHDYLDLKIARDGEFGQKNLAALPDKTARSYTVTVTEVVFWDGSIWTETDTPWEPLEKQQTLAEYLGDKQLVEQYGIEVGASCELTPLEQSDLWRCTCGAVNRENEDACHKCRLKKERIFGVFDVNALKTKLEDRLTREAEVAEKKRKAEARRAELEQIARMEKARNRKKISVIAMSAVVACVACTLLITKVVIPSVNYNNAGELMDNGEYESAIAAFEAMDGYKDSTEQIEACETAIMDEKYDAALELMDSGEYEKAIAAFEALDAYRDSEALASNCAQKGHVVGSSITFGHYEQDNDTSNGAEPVEWIVLDKTDDSALLITKYAIDYRSFADKHKAVTWESSRLREWLNGEFVDLTFDVGEQENLMYTTIKASANPNYKTDAGKDTIDRVFLLGSSEAKLYFSNNDERKCIPTPYSWAVAKGLNYRDDMGVEWWLRTPGNSDTTLATVDNDGSIYYCGNRDEFHNYVRPAIWVSYEIFDE